MSVRRFFRRLGRYKKKKLIKPLSAETLLEQNISTSDVKSSERVDNLVPTVKSTDVSLQIFPNVKSIVSPSSGKIPLRVSLNRQVESDSKSTGQTQESGEFRRTLFTQDSLDKYWENFAQNSKETYFKSVFQYCKPTLKENFLIEISVINPEQERKFKEELVNIKTFLSEGLQNDLISFEIHVKENERPELIFTNKEKYEYLLKQNPDLELLVKEFNLRLD